MRPYLLLIILAAGLISCGGKTGDERKKYVETAPATAISTPDAAPEGPAASKGITANEKSGLNEITHFYGGKCKYSIGDAKNGKKFFRIDISKSGSLDSSMQIAELNASNIAILFYKELREERNVYSEIRPVIHYSGGQTLVKTYESGRMDIVLAKMAIVREIALALKDKQYDALAPLLNDKSEVFPYNKMDLIEKIKKAEPNLGNVKEFVPYGFMFAPAKNKQMILHISGVLLRDQQNNEFSLDFDPASTKNEALFLNYKL